MRALRTVVALTLGVAPAFLLTHAGASAPVLSVAPQGTDGHESAYAEVDEATARGLVKGCKLPREMKGGGTPGSQTVLQFTVSETGKLLGVRRIQGGLTHELAQAFASCHFAPYKVNGTPSAFQSNITIDVK